MMKPFFLSLDSSILPTTSFTIVPRPYWGGINVLFRTESTAVMSSLLVSLFSHSLYTNPFEMKETYGNGTEHPSDYQYR